MKHKKKKVNTLSNNIFDGVSTFNSELQRMAIQNNDIVKQRLTNNIGTIFNQNSNSSTDNNTNMDISSMMNMIGNTKGMSGGNKFKGGGNIQGYMQAGATAVDLVDNAIKQAQIADTSKLENSLEGAGLQSTKDDNLDTLSNDWSNAAYFRNLSGTDLRSNKGDFLNSIYAGNKGAMAGFQAGGGWGAAIGGVIGTGSSIIGSLVGRSKAKKKAAELNERINNANAVLTNSFNNRADNINDNTMSNLEINMYNSAALGGNLFAPGGMLNTDGSQFNTETTYINNGGTHEENPYDGVLMGYDNQGVPNKVEEGEVIWDDYVFSNRINVPKDIKKKLKLKDGTFADAAKQLGKLIEEQPNDSIAKRTYNNNMNNLREAQEIVKTKRERARQLRAFNNMSADEKLNMMQAAQQQAMQEQQMQEQQNIDDVNMQAYGGNLFGDGDEIDTSKFKFTTDTSIPDISFLKPVPINPYINPITDTLNDTGIKMGNSILGNNYYGDTNISKKGKQSNKKIKFKTQDLRYAPAVGGAISALQSILSKPDESAANNIINASKKRNYMPIQFNPIGEYMKPKYFDLDYAINEANAQSGATRRNILNTAMNRGAAIASLLAADYNALNNIGKLRRQADEYNDAREDKMLTFNRGTSQYNSEGQLKADMANQSSMLNSGNTYLNAVMNAERIRQAVRAQRAQEVSANLTNMFNNLGNIGREAYNFNMLNNMPGFTWMFDRNTGNSIYKASKTNTKI